MRVLLWLALLLPALALAAPDEREWTPYNGERVEVTYVDGSKVTGTVVAIEAEQVRLRKDDGSVTMVPMSVVSTVEAAPGAEPPSPEREVVAPRPKPGPSIGVGVGVGVGPVSVGVGGVTGRGQQGEVSLGGHYSRNIVGVRYPMRGRETIDFLLFDDHGGVRQVPEDLQRPRAMREFVFTDEWGQAVAWQTAWAAMGAERDYILEVKKIDRTLIPMRAAENAMAIGGLGLVIWAFVDGAQQGVPADDPRLIAGGALGLGSIVFDVAVVGPTRTRLRTELGRKSLQRAQDHFAKQ